MENGKTEIFHFLKFWKNTEKYEWGKIKIKISKRTLILQNCKQNINRMLGFFGCENHELKKKISKI